eukprot:6213132-Pleurochrysis_carterae.AAC.1
MRCTRLNAEALCSRRRFFPSPSSSSSVVADEKKDLSSSRRCERIRAVLLDESTACVEELEGFRLGEGVDVVDDAKRSDEMSHVS